MKFNPLKVLKIVGQFEIINKDSIASDVLIDFLKELGVESHQFKYCLNEFVNGSSKCMVVTNNGVRVFGVRVVGDGCMCITEYEPKSDPNNNLRSGNYFSEFEVFLLTNGSVLANSVGFYQHIDFPSVILNSKEYQQELNDASSQYTRKYIEEKYKQIIIS